MDVDPTDIPLAEPGPVTMTKVKSLWYMSDMLVIYAGDKMFQVPLSILVRRSPIFRDMKLVARKLTTITTQPAANNESAATEDKVQDEGGDGESNNEETHEGIPVVRLPDDAANVEAFLQAIFNSAFFPPPPVYQDEGTVRGILKLSHKYEVNYLFRRALQHVEVRFPFDLGELVAEVTRRQSQVYPLAYWITIELGKKVNAPWVLPAAYYMLCSHGVSSLLQEYPGYLDIPEERMKCIRATTAFTAAMSSVHSFTQVDAAKLETEGECDDPATCYQTFRDLHARLLDAISAGRTNVLTHLSDCRLKSAKLCSKCQAYAQAEYENGKQEFWNGLPEIFDLPSWEELLRERAEVMRDPSHRWGNYQT
ncbi:hypothetical protein R3P38DRAFT_2787929 [Favolaschia claudopus]|uniref:BTB domain-containing protein n=1 Tax=Favolaschia claudopus TaxID=2862362 RepID=A0AAW0AMM7_9AGAR